MISQFQDDAWGERQRLIGTAQVHWQSAAQSLADRCMKLEKAISRALYWLDEGAPGRARQELQEAK